MSLGHRSAGQFPARAMAAVLAAVLALCVSSSAVGAVPATGAAVALPSLAGRTLSDALRLLQDRGWPVVFSSRLVRDSMRVANQPEGASSSEVLTDLLRPHGLSLRPGARGRLVVVAADARSAATDDRGRSSDRGRSDDRGRSNRQASASRERTTRAATPTTDDLQPALTASVEEEIVVTPGRDARRGSSIVLFARGTDDLVTPPQLGDDALSAVAVLPGAQSADGAGQLQIRGGGDDDVLVRLDGLELVRPYHLGDFDSAVSFVTPSAVERAELLTGGYPAQYGDRMGGVVDLTTRAPAEQRHFALGLSTLDFEGSASGRLSERASWLLTGRRGSYQWPLELSGRDEHPSYWDTFGKVALDLSPSQSLLVDALVARDRYELSPEHRAPGESYGSAWDSGYAWLRHTAVLGRDLYAETVVGAGDVDHVRSGRSTALEDLFSARDRRALESVSARQDWHLEVSHLAAVEWGADYERSQTRLDFQSDRRPDAPWTIGGAPALLIEPSGDGSASGASIDEGFGSSNVAAYASTQIHPAPRLALEIGLRRDVLTLSDESHWSPRLSAAWEISPATSVRASWGWFYQSQRPYELQLEERDADGIPGIGSERSEHQDLSFEHRLARGMTFAVAAYRRRLDAPRVRFENLFDPVLVFPELGFDRVRIAPDRGSSEGVELTVRQPRRGRFGWWANFTESSVVDEIDGRSVPRSTDQPESFRAGLNVRAGHGFDLDLLWQYHTGWPTTAVETRSIERADGEVEWVPVLGPRNGERLPDYHRLDVRIARSWSLGFGRLEAHVDLLDLYDRQNLRGFENLHLVPDGSGGVEVERKPVMWTGFVPSVGVRWTF